MIRSQLALLFPVQGFAPLSHIEAASRPTADLTVGSVWNPLQTDGWKSCSYWTSLIWSNLSTSVIICITTPAHTVPTNGKTAIIKRLLNETGTGCVTFLTLKLEGWDKSWSPTRVRKNGFLFMNLFQSKAFCATPSAVDNRVSVHLGQVRTDGLR